MVVRYASARFHYGEHEVLRYNYDRGTELHTQPAQRARRHRSIRRSGQNRAASTKYENKTVEHTLTSAVIEEDADRIAVEQLPEFGMKTKKEMGRNSRAIQPRHSEPSHQEHSVGFGCIRAIATYTATWIAIGNRTLWLSLDAVA